MAHEGIVHFLSREDYGVRLEAVSPQRLKVVCKGAISANSDAVNLTVQNLRQELASQKLSLPMFQVEPHTMSKTLMLFKFIWDSSFVRPGKVVDTIHVVAKKGRNAEVRVGYRGAWGKFKVLHTCLLRGDLSKAHSQDAIKEIVGEGIAGALSKVRQVASKQREMLGRHKRAHPKFSVGKMLCRII